MSAPSRAAAWGHALALAALVVAVDQITKQAAVSEIARGDRVEVLPFLDLVHVVNQGIAFGFLGDGSRGVVVLITLAALALVLVWFAVDPFRALRWPAVGLLAGGALGNLADRLREDGVIDFIDLPAWPSFNLADVAITAGAVLLVLGAIAGTTTGEGEGEP